VSEPAAVLERIAADGIKVVDFRFTDLTGCWRHIAREAGGVDEELLRTGLLIDSSPLPGWREVNEAYLLLRPDLTSLWPDPFAAQPTLIVLCDGADAASGLGYERDPRSTALRAAAHLAGSRHADEVRVAVEIGFSLFDSLKLQSGPEGLGYMMAPGAAHGPATASHLAGPPVDGAQDIRAEIAAILATLGIETEGHGLGHAPSQNVMALASAALTAAADRVQALRYVTRMVAASYGKASSFLPQPQVGSPGLAMQVGTALFAKGRPAFFGQGYADLSASCLHFVAGVMQHARAINAFTNPTTNSYRRLRFGRQEPTLLAYAAHNRSAAIRIPYASRPEGKRVELTFPDPTANPYLAFTAILMAGLDGIERRIEPGDPADRNLYDLPLEEAASFGSVCRSLDEALDALERDREFLQRGEVMPETLIDAYVRVKRQEIAEIERLPHPAELILEAG
jgi:glutamine synthetase